MSSVWASTSTLHLSAPGPRTVEMDEKRLSNAAARTRGRRQTYQRLRNHWILVPSTVLEFGIAVQLLPEGTADALRISLDMEQDIAQNVRWPSCGLFLKMQQAFGES